MREYASPLQIEVSSTGILTDDIVTNGVHHPDAVVLSRPDRGGWLDVTAAEFLDQVRAVAKGLVAAGVEQGDRVGLLSKTRYEWTLLDYAIWFAGGVTVPIYDSSSAEQIQWILQNSSARAVVAETGDHLDRIASVRADLPDLEHVWALEDRAVDVLASLGSVVSDEAVEQRRSSVTPQSLATIIYTSGTTGPPKGCSITHGNFMFELEVAVEELCQLFDDANASTLLFLPLAHVLARIVQIGAMKKRVRLGHSSGAQNLIRDLQRFEPTFVLAVPRVFEQVFNAASQNAAIAGRGRTFDRAVDAAIAYSRSLDGGRPSLAMRSRIAIYDRLVYDKIRTLLGGRCTFALSGGAPLGERLGHFYRGVGVVVLEGYGLTETTGALSVNAPQLAKMGTVGRPLPGTSVRLDEEGELLVRGRHVFAGYWQAPEATREALDADGWLHTGDLGEIDDEGFLKITGRKKEMIVTAGGKNVAPAHLEDQVKAHPLVSQCMVVGDGQPFVAALITIDPESFSIWAAQNGKSGTIADLADDTDLRRELARAVDKANETVSQAESIRKFAVVPVEWTEEDGLITPSLKVRRGLVLRQFREQIEGLYANGAS